MAKDGNVGYLGGSGGGGDGGGDGSGDDVDQGDISDGWKKEAKNWLLE